jgi:Xaa-Pro aminopeptidase
MSPVIDDEAARVAGLLDAQARAAELFEAIDAEQIVQAGVTESQASNAIRDLAAERYGVSRHWHKRVVRSGPNTLEPYAKNPPDRTIDSDDIVFLDLGPIFAEWEADFGRTFVLGDDPVKRRLRDDLPILFDAGRAYFDNHPDVTGEQLFTHVVDLAAQAGWEWGGTIAGHLLGEFPHDSVTGEPVYSRVMPGHDRPMRGVDEAGRIAHWILEIHIVDRPRQIGGFYEELLDVGL